MRSAIISPLLSFVVVFAASACKEEAPKKKSDNDDRNGLYDRDYSSPYQSSGSGVGQYGSQSASGTCSSYRDQLSCQSGGNCLWNPSVGGCSDNFSGSMNGMGSGNQCSSIFDQNQCNQAQAQGCSWGVDYLTNQVRCGHSCEQNTSQSQCQAAAGQGCQWGQAQLGSNVLRCLPAGSFPQQGLGNGYQQPGYQQPGYQQPGYQQPGYQQPGYQQPGFY